MKITLKQLALFQAVAKYGNVTQAAQALFLTQSAASMSLSQLETQLKKPLFDRVGKRLILNTNGKQLLPKVIEVIGRVKEIEQEGNISAKDISGELKIGASTTIGNYILPKIISRFIAKYPQIKISLQVANTEQIINQLLKFNIDIAYIEDKCHSPEINTSIWGEDRLILFASRNHPLIKKKHVTLKDLNNTQWILRETGSGTRKVFEKAIEPYLNNINILLELGSSEAIKQAVAECIGISCLSKAVLALELKAGNLVELQCKSISFARNFYKLIHKDKYQTTLLQLFQSQS